MLLLYTRTDIPHHPSIVAGIRALRELAAANGFLLMHSEDPSVFAEFATESVSGPSAGSTASSPQVSTPVRPTVLVFLNTAIDEVDPVQRDGLVQCIRGGSGFVGIHSASFFEKDWPWYEALVGARFAGHPEPQEGRIDVTDRNHPATRGLPSQWVHMDEWYNFRSLPAGLRILATVDESTYTGGTHGALHPVMWCHTYEGSRSFYTALGHTEECFGDDRYLAHVLGGIRWAARLAD